ncbi:hypothetical protein BT93_I0272 [Corymbia citriodora subsp. variegata]|nr:hypothetical protein BT93_I0272 [Corymbia citriodora subsp. variegata]
MARIEFSANPGHLLKRPRPTPPSDQDDTGNSSVDYISKLPDAIILHIFSFLTTKDAMKTSVLSKQWRYKWTANPHISFSMSFCANRTKFRSFLAFMKAVRLRCTAIKVKSFLFDAPYAPYLASSRQERTDTVGPTLDWWLHFAVKHNIEEVSMILRKDNEYALPQFVFRCTTLVSFHVSCCHISMMVAVKWTSLKRLHIDHAELKDDAMMRILSGCPVLEFFELKRCWGFKHVKIESRGLKELVIDSHRFRGAEILILKISAPHLLKFRLLGDSKRGEFKVDKISSLVEAELNFSIKTDALQAQAQAHAEFVKRLVENLHPISKLVMGSWCLQVLSSTKARGLFLPSLKCRHLTFHVAADHVGALWMAKILESSPHLEKLCLQITCTTTFWVNTR